MPVGGEGILRPGEEGVDVETLRTSFFSFGMAMVLSRTTECCPPVA